MENKEKKKTIHVNVSKVFEYFLYLLGLACIGVGLYFYSKDLGYYGSNPFRFYEEMYVGGDAFNYMISASRSTAIMIKSLIWIVLGSLSILVGRTLTLSYGNKNKNV